MIRPDYYKKGKFEAIEVIQDQDFDFEIGSVVKYLFRYRYKGTPIKDLIKAKTYIALEIEKLMQREEEKSDKTNSD